MKRVQVLLALSTSLRTAFPDRADLLLTEIERWFPFEAKPDLGPTCALCGFGRPPHARAFVGARPEARFCVYGARPHPSDGPSIALCAACIDRAQDAEGSLPRILADAVRALRSPDPDANEAAIRRLEEIHARWTPGRRPSPCGVCGGDGPAVAPNDTIVCTACLATAHHVLHSASASDWTRLAREIDESDDLDGALAAWDHLRALGDPSADAIDAVTRRIADVLEVIAGTDEEALVSSNVVMDTSAEERSARLADLLLTRHHPSEAARRRLLAACMRIAETLDHGSRFYRRDGQDFEEISEEFDVLCRFAIPRSQELFDASANGAVALYGAPLACDAAARRIAHWGRDEMIAIGSRGGTTRLHSVPEGAIVWIADWSSVMPDDRNRLLARPGRWRVFVGARDRDELLRDALLFRRLVVEELRLPD